jgi:hypothetical protein
VVIGGSVSVMTNGEESHTFKIGKGLRQGDPLSPLLFNLVANALNRMLAKASREGLVLGLLGGFRQGGILSLQYADDTLLFSTPNYSSLRNLKGVLMLFDQVSEMRTNFHKSEVIPLNLEDEVIHEISHILACAVGSLLFKYLEVHLHFDMLKREDLWPILDKLIKRVVGWRGQRKDVGLQ